MREQREDDPESVFVSKIKYSIKLVGYFGVHTISFLLLPAFFLVGVKWLQVILSLHPPVPKHAGFIEEASWGILVSGLCGWTLFYVLPGVLLLIAHVYSSMFHGHYYKKGPDVFDAIPNEARESFMWLSKMSSWLVFIGVVFVVLGQLFFGWPSPDVLMD